MRWLAGKVTLPLFVVSFFVNLEPPLVWASSIVTPQKQRSVTFESWLDVPPSGSSISNPGSADSWLGGRGYWDNGVEWSAGVPGSDSNVFINTGKDAVILDQSASIDSLTLGGATGTSTLTEPFGRELVLQIAGALTINSTGSLTLAGDAVSANANSSNAGTINLNNASVLSFNAGFTNTGSIHLNGEVARPGITVAGSMTNSGNIVDLDNSAMLNVGGAVNNSGGIFVYSFTSGTATNSATGSINAQYLTVNGDLMNAGSVFGLGRGSQFAIAGMLTNSGRFDVSYATANVGGVNNGGQVIVGGVLTVHGDAYNSGIISEEFIGPSGGQNLVVNGTLTNAPAGTIQLSGLYIGGVTAAAIVNQGTIDVENNAPLYAGSLSNSGTIETGSTGGGNTISVSGTLTNSAGGVLSLGGMSDVANFNYVNNAGSISIANGATLDVNGGSHAVATTFPGFLNSGTLLIAQGGSLSSALNFTQISGQTTVDGTLRVAGHSAANFAAGAVYGNGGTIQSNVISNAAFNMGDMPMTVGQMAINGNYTQGANGSLAFDIASLTSYDQLNVSGRASLNGTLYVDLLNGYVPQIGNMFDIMNFAGQSGKFSMVLGLPISNQEHFVLEYNPTNLTLDVVPGPVAQASSGHASGNADYYEPYVSDVMQGSDLLNNLSSAPSASAPEPGSIALLCSGMLAIVGRRRKILP